MQIEEGFPGGQKSVFRVRRPTLFGPERTKSNMSLKARWVQQLQNLKARKWHTYATLVRSKTEKVSRTPRIIHEKTPKNGRWKNAFGLDVLSETLIFKVQQHGTETVFETSKKMEQLENDHFVLDVLQKRRTSRNQLILSGAILRVQFPCTKIGELYIRYL